MVVAVNTQLLRSAMDLTAWTTSKSGTLMDQVGANKGMSVLRRSTPTPEVLRVYSNTKLRTQISMLSHRLHRPRRPHVDAHRHHHHHRLLVVTLRRIGRVQKGTHAVSTSPTTIARQMVPRALDGSVPNGVQSRITQTAPVIQHSMPVALAAAVPRGSSSENCSQYCFEATH